MRRALFLSLVMVGCGHPTAAQEDAGVTPEDTRASTVDVDTLDVTRRSTGLVLDPWKQVLAIDTGTTPPSPGRITYQALEQFEDGSTRDVTAETTFVLEDPSVGSFTGATFTSATTLAARWGTTTNVMANGSRYVTAELTLLQLRKEGSRNDLWFLTPYMNPASPARGVLRHRTDAKLPASHVVARVSNDADNPEGVDAVPLVGTIRAMSEGSEAYGCEPRMTADLDKDGNPEAFLAVPPGTQLCFEVAPPRNTWVKPKTTTGFLDAVLEVTRVDSTDAVDRRFVVFVVPGMNIGR